MSWISKLVETYDEAQKLDIDTKPLPVGHIEQNGHILVRLDSKGNFVSAEVLRQRIVIPATESSAGRTSGKSAHPLVDSIEYVAKSYPEYASKEIKNKDEAFGDYLGRLQQWHEYEKNPLLAAVLAYVKKDKIIEDLVRAKVLHLDDDGKLPDKWKDKDKPANFSAVTNKQSEAKIYWEISGVNCCEDKGLQLSWQKYYRTLPSKEAICYVSGEYTKFVSNHPRYVRNAGDGAKLISSNDSTNYTYRGRFTKPEEAVTISYEASQKAHLALAWLISRQGFRNGDQAIVSWAVSGETLPDFMETPDEFADFEITDADPADENAHNLGEVVGNKLRKHIAGYRQKFTLTDNIITAVLDSALGFQGRMSLAYYREFLAYDFFDQLERWYTDFAWWQYIPKGKGAKGYWTTVAPSPKAIAQILHTEAEMQKKTIARLLPCIIEGRQIPADIMRGVINKASNPNGVSASLEHRRNVTTACALFRGYSKRNNPSKEYSMSLEENNTSRDYLYGRLLAVAENIENFALQGANRATNAERLMQRFSIQPYSTWLAISDKLRPYISRMKGSSESTGFIINREKELANIHSLFSSESFKDDSRLSPEYLLGYFSQKHKYFNSKENKNEEVNS